MPGKKKVTVSNAPTKYKASAAERRAAWLAEIANKQAELKHEAAERRAKLGEHVSRDSAHKPAGT